MTIKNPEEYLAGVWDWGILRGCFGETQVAPTDIDGLVERKGRFLLLEAKKPGVGLKTGQRITFEALLKTGVFTIVIVWGKTDAPEMIEIWTQRTRIGPRESDLNRLRCVVSDWYEWADREEFYYASRGVKNE